MVDVLIRGVPEEIVEVFKLRAREHNLSLQGELRQLLIDSAAAETPVNGAALAREVREHIERRRGSAFGDDSAEMVGADRDSQ